MLTEQPRAAQAGRRDRRLHPQRRARRGPAAAAAGPLRLHLHRPARRDPRPLLHPRDGPCDVRGSRPRRRRDAAHHGRAVRDRGAGLRGRLRARASCSRCSPTRRRRPTSSSPRPCRRSEADPAAVQAVIDAEAARLASFGEAGSRQDTGIELPSVPAARVGLWGSWDCDDLSQALLGRVASAELARRLPGVLLRFFAPYGDAGGRRTGLGEPVEELGPHGSARARALLGRARRRRSSSAGSTPIPPSSPPGTRRSRAPTSRRCTWSTARPASRRSGARCRSTAAPSSAGLGR